MIVKPAMQSAGGGRQPGQITGVAISVFLFLMALSVAIAVPLSLNGAGWRWIVFEILVLNFIGGYTLLAFKVAEQWEKAIVLSIFARHGATGFRLSWSTRRDDAACKTPVGG